MNKEIDSRSPASARPERKTPTLGSQALKLYGYMERLIIITLLVMLMVVVLMATWTFTSMLVGRVAVKLAGGVALDDAWLVEIHYRMALLREVFSAFLLLLIGIELMQTIVMYLNSHVLHVEVVLTVAIIAMARHTIDLNIDELTSPFQLMGMGLLLLALSMGYYFFRRASSGPAGR
jgi:uncharacterized membrane protein (DUF373 family)